MKVCLVGSSGGHLTHLYMLKPFWKNKDHFWVTFDKEDARSLLEGEKMYPCYYPTNRSLKALIKNTKIAWNVLHKEKPDLIISCGAAVAVPFFFIGKMMGAKLVYIEVFDRIDKPTMTGKMVYFSLSKFVEFAKGKGTSCVMCHEENELKKQQKTAIITLNENDLITSYEEKPKEPKGNLAVPPFYCYRACDVKRIQEALDNGCGYDAPGSFAAWLSKQTPMHAYVMPGKRYDIGDINSYEYVKSVFSR